MVQVLWTRASVRKREDTFPKMNRLGLRAAGTDCSGAAAIYHPDHTLHRARRPVSEFRLKDSVIVSSYSISRSISRRCQ
jgi:hypothetical protein